MYMQDAAALAERQTIPLDLGGEVNVTFTIFHEHDGTVAHIISPTMEARLSLVSSCCVRVPARPIETPTTHFVRPLQF